MSFSHLWCETYLPEAAAGVVFATVVENVPASHPVHLYSTNWLTTPQPLVNVVFNQLVENRPRRRA
jgi:hypothetical protein